MRRITTHYIRRIRFNKAKSAALRFPSPFNSPAVGSVRSTVPSSHFCSITASAMLHFPSAFTSPHIFEQSSVSKHPLLSVYLRSKSLFPLSYLREHFTMTICIILLTYRYIHTYYTHHHKQCVVSSSIFSTYTHSPLDKIPRICYNSLCTHKICV